MGLCKFVLLYSAWQRTVVVLFWVVLLLFFVSVSVFVVVSFLGG